MKLAETRRREAQVRQEAHTSLSIEQKLAKLDARFGVGKGATLERARLLTRLKAPVEAPKLQEEKIDPPASVVALKKEEKPSGKKQKNKKNKRQSQIN